MNSNHHQSPDSPSESERDAEFIAKQLRKPSGDFAPKVGQKMNQVNKPLYDLTFDIMELEENDDILEIGFGTGKFFDKLFDMNDTIKVSGIDYSKDMVETARKYNHEHISKGNLNVLLGNSDAIPFPDQSFDKVFCNMVIYFWDEPELHLMEVKRTLKPGGTFYTGIRSRESMHIFPFVEHGFNLYSIKEWKDILNQNGFVVRESHKKFDPEINLQKQENKLRLESCCIVADKRERSS